MNSEIALLLLQDGIINAAVYTLLAVALVLVFSVTRIIFIPQGEFVTFGALSVAVMQAGRVPSILYLLFGLAAAVLVIEVIRHFRGGKVAIRSTMLWALAAPIAAGLVAIFALPESQIGQILLTLLIVVPMAPLLYRLVYRPMAASSVLTLLISSMALHVVLVGLGLLFFGPEGSRTSSMVGPGFSVGGIIVSGQGMLVVLSSAILATAMFATFKYTVAGKALRAAAMNRVGARLVGIPLPLTGELALAVSVAIGVVSGVLMAPMTTLYYDSGFLIGLKGFVAAIMGGLAGYFMAGVGALLVGLLESFSSYWASAFKEVLVFSLIIPVMWWRSRSVRHVEDEE